MSELPFLKHRKLATIIMAKRKPEGSMEMMGEEGEEHPQLMYAAEDLISAVHAKDAKAVAEALRAAFDMLDSEDESPESMNDGEME